MIAATCYGLPVHKSLKPTASRISEITPKAADSLARGHGEEVCDNCLKVGIGHFGI
jgi:hypothetical protein